MPNSPIDLLTGLSSQSAWTASAQLQINDSRQIITWWSNFTTAPVQNYLQRVDATVLNGNAPTTLIAAANGAGGFNDFNEIWPTGITFANGTLPVFQTRTGNNTSVISSGTRPNFTSRTFLPSFGSGFRPMVSDNDTAVVRYGGDGGAPIVMLDRVRLTDQSIPPINVATTGEGFSQIGQSPSISKYDEAIAFYADLNQAGATAFGTNPGPGIFVSIRLANGTRKIVRIAGRLVEDNSAQGGNDDGICDAGETCVQGELGTTSGGSRIFFSSYDQNSRIDVAYIASKPGIQDDLVMVSFIATPNIASDIPGRTFTNQAGLWTQTVEISDNNAAIRDTVTGSNRAVPVAQVGDAVSGNTITGLQVYDQIANNVDRVAFWASSANGNMIIRAIRDPGTPVIFIAGVGGSELRNASSGSKLWPPESTSSDLSGLSINNSVKVPDVIRNFKTGLFGITEIQDSVYTQLLDSFKDNGFVEYNLDGDESKRSSLCGASSSQDLDAILPELRARNPKLFVFSYDWRKTNSGLNADQTDGNTRKLKDYIQCIRHIYPNSQVNIVAHSMGGLLARRYLIENQTAHNVKTLITVGTPWLGAPRAMHALETGSFIGAAFSDSYLQSFSSSFSNFLFAGQIKQLIGAFPGAHQLLPSESFFALGGTPLRVNGVYLDFAATKLWINSRHFGNPANQMSDFHITDQDDFRNFTYGVSYYHIYGRQKGNKTVGTIEPRTRAILGPDGSVTPVEQIYPYRTSGDGTVPLISSSRRVDSTDGLNASCGTSNDKRCIGVCYADPSLDDLSDHNGMTKNPQVQSHISQILRFSEGFISANPSFENGDCVLEAPSILSPGNGSESHYLNLTGITNVQISDNQGNSNQSIGTAYKLNVPGVTYDVIGANSSQIITPVNNAYTLKFIGTGNVSSIEGIRGVTNALDDATRIVRYDDLLITNGRVAELRIVNDQIESLKQDLDGDGTPETVIPPTRVISDPQSADLQPPTTSLVWRSQRVTITLADAGSGVKRVFHRKCTSTGCTEQFVEVTGDESGIQFPNFSFRGIELITEDNAGNRSDVVYYPRCPYFC